MNDFDNYAIITIRRRQVHLDMTFNPDANEPIQIESYSSDGWTLCQHCPLLTYAFWPTWSDWNGHISGGIFLTDNQSPRQIRAIISRFPRAHAPSDIPTLKNGTYLINVSDHIL